MHRVITILILFCGMMSPDTSSAQSLFRLTGQVQDTAKKAVSNATVSLLRARDSAVIKIDITESNGQFEFNNIKEDSCLLLVTAIGYASYSGGLIVKDINQSDLVLSPIELQPAEATSLQAVTVVSTKPFVQRTLDRTIVNVDAFIGAAGSSALDMLERSPGVQVDANGGISLKGRQGVMVFINDKPTYMSTADLANYLRSLPASTLDVIEIMPTPPAKYDAAGNAGVINIRIKKLRLKGFNGNVSLSYGQGFYGRTSNSVNFNYRVNKINFFGNIGYNKAKYLQELEIDRRFLKSNGTLDYIFTQDTRVKKDNTSTNVRLGLDYYISKRSVLGIVVNGFSNPYREDKFNNAAFISSQATPDSTIHAISASTPKWTNQSANLNYSYRPDSTRKEISVNIDHVRYRLRSASSLVNNVFAPDNTLKSSETLIGDLPATIEIQTAKVDYVHPLRSGGMAEAGWKTSWVRADNTSEFFDKTNNGLVMNDELTNYFNYKENIVAGYVNYNKEFRKLSVQAGLRLEHTVVRGDQQANGQKPDSSFKKIYTNLFPTFFALYRLDSANKHQLIFSYGRRIDRPNYQDMNPFQYPVDKFTYFAGNPFLVPTFSHNLELSHVFNNVFTTTVQYSYTKDIISETIEQLAGIFIIRPGNVGKRISWGASVNADIRPEKAKWLSSQLSASYTFNKFTGLLYAQQVNEQAGSLLVSANNQFQFSRLWSAELFAGYQTRTVYAQIQSEPIWVLNTGVRRKIFKEKGSIRLNIRDAFAGIRPRGSITNLANSTATFSNRIDNRAVVLSFTYGFSKGKSLQARQSGSSDPEQGRIRTN